jgi:CheY-like chemotaxis protein
MIKVLIIEDNDAQKTVMREAIEAWNLTCDEEGRTEEKIAYDLREDDVNTEEFDSNVYKLIFYNRYDCIVLDINWGTGKELGGSHLARRIIESKRIPIFIYSGNIQQVDDMDEQLGFKKYERTTPFVNVIRDIVKLKKTKVIDLLGYEGTVDTKILNIFWKDIESTLSFIENIPEHNDADALTRLITTRIVESLSGGIGNVTQKFFEFYIHPSLTVEANNGDIYKKIELAADGREITTYYLIITPTCQLNRGRNINNVNMLKIEFTHEKIDGVRNAQTRNNKINNLNTLITNPPASVHFLPPFSNAFCMGIINFNDISSVPKISLQIANRIATINPAYMKDIQARFGQYFSRQGQPDIDAEHLVNTIFSDN